MLKNLEKEQLFFLSNRKNGFLLGICFLVFIFSLVLTLDLAVALAIFILSVALVIFASSFSRGWLFLLSAALLFSSLRLGQKDILFFDLSLLGLILIGLFKIFLEKGCLNYNRRYDWLFLSIVVLSLIGAGISYYKNGAFHPEALRLGINFFFYWFLFLVFQYFFQTEKRIRRFFSVLIFCSFFQSLYGLILLILNLWTRKSFLDSDLTSITPFILIGIFSSWGMWLSLSKKMAEEASSRKWPLFLIQAILFFQLLVFALISSSTEIVFLGLGFLFLGVLSRNRRLVLLAAFLTLIFSFFSFYLTGVEDFSQSGMKFIRDLKIASSSFLPFGERKWSADFFRQNNSYFYFWGNLGIAGILALVGLLNIFFTDVYAKYKKSEGEKRIWLMVILGILIAFLALAFKERVFFSGSVAVIFWLLAGVVQNLGVREVVFGLTETHLIKKEKNSLFQAQPEVFFDRNQPISLNGKKNYLDSCQPRFDFYKH